MNVEAYYVLLAGMVVTGVLLLRDGLRLARHFDMAERLIDAGLRIDNAYRLSGCYFWDQPWYRRLHKPYPSLHLPGDLGRLLQS